MSLYGFYVSPNSTRLNIAYMMDAVNSLSREEQDIFFRMSRGCLKKSSKDPVELSYHLNVCAKENDNEVILSKEG